MFNTATITSGMQISVPYLAGELLDVFKEFEQQPEFQQKLTYRRFVFGQQPITGDVDTTTYTDYTIYGTADIQTVDSNLVQAGLLQSGDAVVFLPPRIRTKTDGTLISPEFRPQTQDYILYDNVTYRIENLTFERIGESELFVKILGKRLQNTNPVVDWNSSYDTTKYKVGGGYS